MHVLEIRNEPVTTRFAIALTRLLTWGMDELERSALLLECAGDWESMHPHVGGRRVVLRALRGIPAAVLARLNRHDLTAIPAGLALLVVAVSAVGASLLARTYPNDLRLFAFVTALGLGTAAWSFLREPRRLILRRHRVPALLTAVGVLGVAATMPENSDWPYDVPVLDNTLGDALMVSGFVTVGVACMVVGLTPARFVTRNWMLITGTAALTGLVLFGAGQIVWGVKAVVVDPAITASALGVGLGNLAVVHMAVRLRKLDVDFASDTRTNHSV